MLPHPARLSKDLFSEVMKTGMAVHSTNIWLKYRIIGDTHGRFSVSVPKKSCKLAVDRNRARRRVYSALIPKQGVQGVFIAKNNLKSVDFTKLKEEIAFLLGKASVK